MDLEAKLSSKRDLIIDDEVAQRQRLLLIVNSLDRLYHSPRLGNKHNPLDELFYILLSLRTTWWSFERVYLGFRRHFWPWKNLLTADTREIAFVLKEAGFSNVRAKTFKNIAKKLQADFGRVTLAPLKKMSKEEAKAYLLSLPGIGVKTARCVMMYSLGHDVLPVDTHTHRLARRIGVIPNGTNPTAVHRALDRVVPSGKAYALHTNFVAHGRAVCLDRSPKCEECAVFHVCDYGKELGQTKRTPAPYLPAQTPKSNDLRGGSNTKSGRWNVVSLFSGALGIDLGLIRSGFDLRMCVEICEDACATIRANTDFQLWQEDIKHIKDHLLNEVVHRARLRKGREIDVLSGGPPCQSFSTHGRRRAIRDERGRLIFDFLDIVKELQPKTFLLENVRGLLSVAVRHRPLAERGNAHPPLEDDELPGSLFNKVLEKISNAGYRADCFVLNAVNHGAPQIRERVLIFGNRYGLVATPPQPSFSDDPDPGQEPFRTLGWALNGFSERQPLFHSFSERKRRYLQMIPPGGNWRWLPEDVQRESMGRAFFASGGRSGWWRKLSFDYPCPTIMTSPTHASTCMCHPEELRPLSVDECSRIQGFPPGWKFIGSATSQYTQVGNATPVVLGEVAGAVLSDLLTRGMRKGWKTPRAVPDNQVVHVRPHVRTRRWYADGQPLSPTPYHKKG